MLFYFKTGSNDLQIFLWSFPVFIFWLKLAIFDAVEYAEERTILSPIFLI